GSGLHRDGYDGDRAGGGAADRPPDELAASRQPAGGRRRGDRVSRLTAGRWEQRPDTAGVRADGGGPVSAGRPVGPTGPDGGGPQSTGPGRDTPPAGYREERLREMPSLPALYARAVARTGRLVLATIPARDLPPVVLRVDGVRADPTRLAEYQHLVG